MVAVFSACQTLIISPDCVLTLGIRLLISILSRNSHICLQSSVLLCCVFKTDTILNCVLNAVSFQCAEPRRDFKGINAHGTLDKTLNETP